MERLNVVGENTKDVQKAKEKALGLGYSWVPDGLPPGKVYNSPFFILMGRGVDYVVTHNTVRLDVIVVFDLSYLPQDLLSWILQG